MTVSSLKSRRWASNDGPAGDVPDSAASGAAGSGRSARRHGRESASAVVAQPAATGGDSGGRIEQGLAYTACDFIDPRIDDNTWRALLQMVRSGRPS